MARVVADGLDDEGREITSENPMPEVVEVIESDDPVTWDLPSRTDAPVSVHDASQTGGQGHGGRYDTSRQEEATTEAGQGKRMSGNHRPRRDRTRGSREVIRGESATTCPAHRSPSTVSTR